jgi:hypothetical protein
LECGRIVLIITGSRINLTINHAVGQTRLTAISERRRATAVLAESE